MSRLDKIINHVARRRDSYNPCYGMDTLILSAYTDMPEAFRPDPRDVFPSTICKPVAECEDCPIDNYDTWEDLIERLEQSVEPNALSGISPFGVF